MPVARRQPPHFVSHLNLGNPIHLLNVICPQLTPTLLTMDKTKPKKKTKRGQPENLKRRPTTALDARCLEWKRRSRARAEVGPSAAALAAATGNEGPSVDTNPPAIGPTDDHAAPFPGPFDMQPAYLNPDLYEHSQALNNGFDAARRQREEAQWKMKHASMFPIYLALKVKTKDWADPDLAMKDWKPACNCNSEGRTLDVLDIFSQSQ